MSGSDRDELQGISFAGQWYAEDEQEAGPLMEGQPRHTVVPAND